MSWWKRTFGFDFIETVLFVVGSMLSVILVVEVTNVDELGLLATIACVVGFGVRRHQALKALPPPDEVSGGYRLADVEGRLAEVEMLHRRVADLEERVDFAERMLSTKVDPQRLEGPR